MKKKIDSTKLVCLLLEKKMTIMGD